MTQPPAASAAPVSNRALAFLTEPVAAELCLPAADIFDTVAVDAAMADALRGATSPMEIRSAVVAVLTDARQRGNDAIEAAFAARPRAARAVIRSYAWLTDHLVRAVYYVALSKLHPLPNPTKAERLALMAVGGYGRGEMAPHSDVDLLFLTPYKTTPWAESIIESMLYMLWDLKLKVGHASRSTKDCITLAGEDYTIRTSLLEIRLIEGDAALGEELVERLWKELFSTTAADFIDAKLEERAARHRKQGGQRYVVEPNVKEGKGGLRDLQSLYWIGKYVYRVRNAAELAAHGVFTDEDYDGFARAEDYLWTVRCHLHLLAKRASDLLTFDMQVEVAARMGYADGGGRRAVEHFMQDYFRHATRVGELTRIFLTAQEANFTKPAPRLRRLFSRRRSVKPPYVMRQNRLAIGDEEAFLADKLNILRLFEVALKTGLLIHPDAMRLLSHNLKMIDADMRQSKDAAKVFFDVLLKHGNPERALRRMNELGVLAAYIPEFAPIVAMVQYNMYHHYTVDEHTIQCISHLAMIEREELTEELPIASHILKSGINRKVLYAALLLHDIGKGREEDHSVLGAKITRKIAPRLHLTKKEAETAEWLVRNHLMMSDTAQKRDISEPRTVRDFAKRVQTKERLDLLTVLTVCDIRGVGPGTWNNWKAVLIRQLYGATAAALSSGMEDLSRENREAEAKRSLRAALPDWTPKELRAETARHYGPYWQGLPVATHVIFANLLRKLDKSDISFDLHPDIDRDATRACFAVVDHPGFFSRVTGALALVGANIVDARSYTTKDGYATAVFWVQDADGAPYEKSRLKRLTNMIMRTLKGEVLTSTAMKDRDKIKKRERAFKVPTSITFDNEGSEIFTIIEVDTRDRPGLLFDLTRKLAGMNVYISSAVIATYGEQAVDTFYVKDMFGLKFHSQARLDALERNLRSAIETGAKRAVS
ncbi:MAG: [protein-PII] uridylyltransferase [Rhodobacteraceae bacterium]|nr:[protein-PII] uridylyltransferase [Paracoccaceae bacterium]